MRHRRKEESAFDLYLRFAKIGSLFAQRVCKMLASRHDLNQRPIFFAYDTGALEALEWCREHSVRCIVNQMDPNRVEVDLVREEEKLWPGWALSSVQVPEEYFARREREWAVADRVVVNSEFSRRALLKQGVPESKLVVIPLCYDANGATGKPPARNRKPGQPLRVLYLGQVLLRKGIQYLLAAAKQLEHEAIHFDIVGPVGISQKALTTAPANVKFHGRTNRDQIAGWYQNADVFVLPTLSDGFAITQLEAMTHGLPVVTTPCCGDVVSDGLDGFIVPPRDEGALAQIFRRYLAEPELLSMQSSAAWVKAQSFTFKRLSENLLQLEADLS